MPRNSIAALSVATFLPFGWCPAGAQTYPTRPVHVIVGITTASVTDIAVRTIGQEMQKLTGQPWLVENRPGGNLFLATEACVRAAPDGYTLCATNSGSVSYNPHIFSQKPYDIDKDLVPVTNMFFVLAGVIAKKALRANSIQELKQLATAKGAALNFGTLGPGSVPDVFRQWLNRDWNADFADVSYKGGGEIAQALIKGEIDVAYIGLGNMTTQLQTGELKALAVEGPHRSKYLPLAPTFDEAGIGNYPFGGPIWWGIHVPAETPGAIVDKISVDVGRALRTPAVVDFLEKQFLEPAPSSPDQFATFTREDRNRAGEIVRRFNIPKQ
jgi:tripartite-type tricarboxylate transporter receptor subunit TctC